MAGFYYYGGDPNYNRLLRLSFLYEFLPDCFGVVWIFIVCDCRNPSIEMKCLLLQLTVIPL